MSCGSVAEAYQRLSVMACYTKCPLDSHKSWKSGGDEEVISVRDIRFSLSIVSFGKRAIGDKAGDVLCGVEKRPGFPACPIQHNRGKQNWAAGTGTDHCHVCVYGGVPFLFQQMNTFLFLPGAAFCFGSRSPVVIDVFSGIACRLNNECRAEALYILENFSGLLCYFAPVLFTYCSIIISPISRWKRV